MTQPEVMELAAKDAEWADRVTVRCAVSGELARLSELTECSDCGQMFLPHVDCGCNLVEEGIVEDFRNLQITS